MKGLMKYERGVGCVGIRELEKPKIGAPNEVLIKIKAAGVCGTDIHIWKDEFRYWPPVVLGHEFSGVIEEVGPEVAGLKAGDRVTAEPKNKACGFCESCRSGSIQLCPERRAPGWGVHGGFTDYVVMPFELVHLLPDGLPYDIAALCEPMAIVVHEVTERAKIACQDFVVVCGTGPIGIMAAFVAKECGASKVAIIGLNTAKQIRFDAALAVGADYIINAEQEDPVRRISELTCGRGADLVIEATGAAASIVNTAEYVRIGGRICAVGLSNGKEVPFKWNTAMYKAADIYFNFSSSYTSWDRALLLMANTKKDLRRLITHRVTIEKWEETFEDLLGEKGVKAMFIPEDEMGGE